MSFSGEVPSETVSEQRRVEKAVKALFARFHAQVQDAIDRAHVGSPDRLGPNTPAIDFASLTPFKLNEHIEYLTNTKPFSKGFLSLESSSLWFVYWKLHALAILGHLDEHLQTERGRVEAYLRSAQNSSGGFGGAPRWLSHLSTTYAACAVVRLIGAESLVDREALHSYLLSMRCSDGGFRMHEDGEIDMRGTYCALASAALMGVLTPELMEGVADWIKSCQRYDGGISGIPGGESHAGYTYCGMASLCLLDAIHTHLNLSQALRWLVHRQQAPIGGFNGRPNKLLDTCYTFWASACFPMLKYAFFRQAELSPESPVLKSIPMKGSCWMLPFPIQSYVLLACQPCFAAYDEEADKLCSVPGKCGGFCDKPGKASDYYHTCYGLSGLAIIQHWCMEDGVSESGRGEHAESVSRLVRNALPPLEPVCPVFNVIRSRVVSGPPSPWKTHFSQGYARLNQFVDS
eukprot:Gregarina_sp_Pseudo_9__4876@NODE_50_length_4806_cov_19_581708_g47_i0_p2_GENE_NODE_50_length_4806_cov_19_581708_g47_i0NODE_50_length_4806_cov_19_581708_g47_i0_p2_ORF_typecomplete_len460_score56_72Prenyltrans/PF00432_21/7_7e03Prenyltrans/PF00432_21/4e05Prenyltrans/PF00432_21/1_5e10Prenyltrans/PF00432_21/1_9e17Prenyltrans/PF00432_21/1_1e09Prenyltrans/PF00432_21/4_6e06SQHop_cyclase_N/PF13249_6/1_9e05SQHop_cyclase_N/PF13249_6/0_0041SQHop_cyclase_N/PF13249_6/0_021SQHop_cyclase_C/PF13243_6/0_086SQHop_c